MKKLQSIIFTVTGSILIFLGSWAYEEGMFPLNYLNEKNLQDAGLKLSTKDIFNPGGIALTNALVKLGGCTGSFISDQGLIITNHHCVYGGVTDLSNKDHNYLENGFVAKNRGEELSINMPCRITQSYEDVSSLVLEGVTSDLDPQLRSTRISENIAKIRKTESAKTPELSVEVSEMFVGKSYTLFRYILITDVRLVLAPPVTVGQFGGDFDNWEWPRHNGDFSLVRAYVGKDGKPAPYSAENVPYKPAKILKINATGAKENDFVFIMGYPGKTYRHESAPYMQFQQDFQLPEIQKWYQWCIEEMRDAGKDDENKSLAFAGTIQQLANTEKNFRGKMQGLARMELVKKKWEDEAAMGEFAKSMSGYNDVIPALKKLWDRKMSIAHKKLNYSFLNSQSEPFYMAQQIEMADDFFDNTKDETDRKNGLAQFKKNAEYNYSIIDRGYELSLLKELLNRISKFKDLKPVLGKLKIDDWVDKVVAKKEKLFDTAWTKSMARTKTLKLIDYDGPLSNLLDCLEDDMSATDKEWMDIDNQIKALMPRYLDIKQAYKSAQFIPDANSTLRLTYGYIKRYSPNDAEIHTPFTTLKGVFEKANTNLDYRLPEVVADNLRIDNVPPFFKDPVTGEVIVCFLYNLDTTGGNSGSPVLDAEGNLIGINFDRSFTATINDYAWNEKYSRSIGVDIRYVLYVMKYVGKADHLIDELGLKL